MKNNRYNHLIEKVADIVAKTLNEARITRTIDPKIWATVASGISKKYKSDMGATAKARLSDTRDSLILKYVAALLILKLPCPTNGPAFTNGPVFPFWAKRIVQLGGTLSDVIKLYNENSSTPVTLNINQTTDIKKLDSEPVKPVVKKELQPVQDNEEGGVNVKVVLRTTIPSTEGGGHEDTEYESYTSHEYNIIQLLNKLIGEYSGTKKYKCRDGWYSTYWHIVLLDNENNIKVEVDITRERVNPQIWYYINNNYISDLKGIVSMKDLYKYVLNNPTASKSATLVNNIKKYKVTYISTFDDDITHVWVEAEDKREAEIEAKSEYHDIKQIIMVTLLR